MKTAIYLRKSRSDEDLEKKGEGETLARHEKILLEVAKKQNLQVLKIYKEIVSGETIASRPVMQQLLTEVEQGIWEGILVIEIERLARGATIDQGLMAQAFKYSNTKIITPTKIYDPSNEFDEEYFEFGLFMSRREYKTINRRLQQGTITSVKEGKYLGSKPPYGYIRINDKSKGFTLELHPEQAPIVKMIFDLYTIGENGKRLGVSLIARKLNDMNIPAQKGIWVNSSIQTILRNPVYAGKIRWNSRKSVKKVIDGKIKIERPRAKQEDWIIVDGLHPAIIDIETYELAYNYITSNRPHPCPSQCEIKNPLAGIIKCGICGRNMVRRPHGNSMKFDTLMCAVTHCKNKSSFLYLVENMILQALQNWVVDYNVELNNNTTAYIDTNILEKSIKTIETDLINYKQQIDKAHDLLEQGVYDTDTFLSRINIISNKIKDNQLQKESLQNQIETIKKQQEAQNSYIPQINTLINTYHSLDVSTQNNLLKNILEKIVYIKTKKSTKKEPNGDMSISIYPKIK